MPLRQGPVSASRLEHGLRRRAGIEGWPALALGVPAVGSEGLACAGSRRPGSAMACGRQRGPGLRWVSAPRPGHGLRRRAGFEAWPALGVGAPARAWPAQAGRLRGPGPRWVSALPPGHGLRRRAGFEGLACAGCRRSGPGMACAGGVEGLGLRGVRTGNVLTSRGISTRVISPLGNVRPSKPVSIRALSPLGNVRPSKPVSIRVLSPLGNRHPYRPLLRGSSRWSTSLRVLPPHTYTVRTDLRLECVASPPGLGSPRVCAAAHTPALACMDLCPPSTCRSDSTPSGSASTS